MKQTLRLENIKSDLMWLVGRVFCSLILVASFPFIAASAQISAQANVIVLHVNDTISPATSDFIIRGLEKAAADNAQLVIIQLDTPGGLDTSMRDIIKHILASQVPVATFVAPAGARAASAGAFILYASHIAAMTPASNVGAASPVQIGLPNGIDSAPQADDKSDVVKKTPTNRSADTMTKKITNDAAAYIRSLAQLRGRNVQFAEKTVLDAASMSAQEALKANVIDIIANDINDLLIKLNGRQVKLNTGRIVVLNTANANLERIEPDWHSQVLAIIANPQVALILLMVGIFGLFYELLNPGLALPGVVGLISLLLGLYAFALLPVSWAGVALLGLGISLMIAEAFLPSFGIIGAGGVVAFVLGGLFLTNTGIPGFDLSIPFLIGVAVVSAAFTILAGTMAARAHKHNVVTGREEMVGLKGVVTSADKTLIYADVHGESWRIKSDDSLTSGDDIRVLRIEGLTLYVERIDPNE